MAINTKTVYAFHCDELSEVLTAYLQSTDCRCVPGKLAVNNRTNPND